MISARLHIEQEKRQNEEKDKHAMLFKKKSPLVQKRKVWEHIQWWRAVWREGWSNCRSEIQQIFIFFNYIKCWVFDRYDISTWGCPCRKGGPPQTWAWAAECSGWSGRGWSFQRGPTLPAAICGTWVRETFIATPLLLILFKVLNYIQGVKITCRISWQFSRNIWEVIREKDRIGALWKSECWVPT